MQVYLDNSATTKVTKEVAMSVMQAMTDNYGNPSSLHVKGQDAERAVKKAREKVASVIGSKPSNIVFTSGGTEANNLAFGILNKSKNLSSDKKIVISQIEHPAVSMPAKSFFTSHDIDTLRVPVGTVKRTNSDNKTKPLSETGMIDLEMLDSILDENVIFVSIMHVNNEIGTIQPIGEIGNLIKKRNEKYDSKVFFHCDAVQSFAKIPLRVDSDTFSNVDFLSMSSHKIHGPKGIGALYAVAPARLSPLILGGGQESGFRSGTENVPGIVGFGEAAITEATSMDLNAKHVSNLRSILAEGIESRIEDIRINSPREASISGEPGKCSPYILSVSFLGTRGEVLLHSLEQDGIFVSTGSACSSIGKSSGVHSDTLSAIGLTSPEAEGTLRFSFSRYNTEEEIYYVLEKLEAAVARYRKIGSFR